MTLRSIIWTVSKRAFFGLVVVAGIALTAVSLLPELRNASDLGCYWHKGFIRCRGFAGSTLLGDMLSLCVIATVHASKSFIHLVQAPAGLENLARRDTPIFLLLLATWCWYLLALAWPIRWLLLKLGGTSGTRTHGKKGPKGHVDITPAARRTAP